MDLALADPTYEPGSEVGGTSGARSEKKKAFSNFEPLGAKALLWGRPVLSSVTGDGSLSISVPPGRYSWPLVDVEASNGRRPPHIGGRAASSA